MSIKAKQVAGVTTLVVLIVAVLSGYHLATLARLSLQETASARGAPLAGDLPARARGRRDADRRSLRRAPQRRRHPIDPRIQHRLFPPTSPTPRSSNPKGIGRRAQLSVAGGHGDARAGGLRADRRRRCDRAAATPCTRTGRSKSASRFWPASEQFATIRIGVSPLLVRNELQDALRTAAGTVIAVLGDLDARGDAPRAVDAPSDPRHSERIEPPRARRAGCPPRSARGRRVQGPRQFVRSGQRADCRARQSQLLGAGRSTHRPSRGERRLRIGDGKPRGCGGVVLAEG